LAMDIMNIFIDKVRRGSMASRLPPAKNAETINIVNNSVRIPINSNVKINGLTLEINAKKVAQIIMVIKIVLLNVNHGKRLITKYQKINNLASIFEKYTSGLPKAVLINSSLIVSTLSTSFILAVRSIDMNLLYSPNEFIYR